VSDLESRLLASVLADPTSDGPRLVYADWLEENAGTVSCACVKYGGMRSDPPGCEEWLRREEDAGVSTLPGAWRLCDRCDGTGRAPDGRRERAEFIRVQVALAKTPDCRQLTTHGQLLGAPVVSECGMCPACRLRAREAALWRCKALSPLAEFRCGGLLICPAGPDGATTLVGDPVPAAYRRGFVAAIRCPADLWLGSADAILAAHPVEEVRLTTWPGWKMTFDYTVERCVRIRFEHKNLRYEHVFTDDGTRSAHGHSLGHIYRKDATAKLLEAAWPGIRFELPNHADATP